MTIKQNKNKFKQAKKQAKNKQTKTEKTKQKETKQDKHEEKTSTKVITTANRNKGKYNKTRSKSELQVNTCNLPEVRENASDQVAIGFSFVSDWLRGWREFSKPIIERSEAKPMQSRITFDTQMKIALKPPLIDSSFCMSNFFPPGTSESINRKIPIL